MLPVAGWHWRKAVKRHWLPTLAFVVTLSTVATGAISYDTPTHSALSYWAVHRSDCVIANFLTNELLDDDVFNWPVPSPDDTYYQTLDEWVREGAIREDTDPYPLLFGVQVSGVRSLRHWYNPTFPINQRGLSDTSLYGIHIGKPVTDSLSWAWNGGSENNEWDWYHARQYYFSWLTAFNQSYKETYFPNVPYPYEGRDEDEGRAFRALGHIIHLLQDTAQPQHAKRCSHLPIAWR